jgi:hypothetical protein
VFQVPQSGHGAGLHGFRRERDQSLLLLSGGLVLEDQILSLDISQLV